MRRASVLQRSAIRLAMMIATMLAIVVVAVFALLYWQLTAGLQRQLQTRVLEQRDAIIAAAGQNGLPALTEAVTNETSSVRDGDAIFLLVDTDGRTRAGNIEKSSFFTGWQTLDSDGRVASANTPPDDHFLGVWTDVEGSHLLVGRSEVEVSQTQESLWNALLFGLITTIGLAFTLGGLAAWRAQHRINALADTLAAVSTGQLASRAPLTGSGDDLDFVASHLNGAIERLERSVERINQTSSDIAHDLKRPIGRLRQRLEATARRAKPEVRDDIEEAIEDIDSIVETFEALLSISQIESGARRLRFKVVDLASLIREVAAIYRPVAEDAGHVLMTDIPPGSDLQIFGDSELLLQMFVNLIENAIQHCTEPVEIKVSAKAAGHDQIVVEISDQGTGIPEAEREKVFNRLYRIDKSRTTPGNGLGLSIVKAISELHGARIELGDNHPGLRIISTFKRLN